MILPATNITGNGVSNVMKQCEFTDLKVQLNVSAVPSGGAPTLDVYLQESLDQGTTWNDIAHTQFTGAAAVRYFQIAGKAAGSTSPITKGDAALAGETVRQGPFGDQLRFKWVFAAGGGTGPYTMAASTVPKL
jgi:hypothetical protein